MYAETWGVLYGRVLIKSRLRTSIVWCTKIHNFGKRVILFPFFFHYITWGSKKQLLFLQNTL